MEGPEYLPYSTIESGDVNSEATSFAALRNCGLIVNPRSRSPKTLVELPNFPTIYRPYDKGSRGPPITRAELAEPDSK